MGDAIAAFRADRREQAHRLRNEGLTLRAIAEELGVSAPTVLDDLRKGPPTMTATSPVAGLYALLAALDALGVTDVPGRTRRLLASAEQLETDAGVRLATARATREALAERLAGGDLAALDDLAGVSALLGADAAELVATAGRMLRRQAQAALAAETGAVYRELGKLAQTAVAEAVSAGRLLVDVGKVAKALKPPTPYPSGEWPGGQHPWLGTPPVLPRVELDDPQRAEPRLRALAASNQVARILAAAGVLTACGGPAASLYATPPHADQMHFVDKFLPGEVHLAVGDALGWRPGLHMVAPGGEAGVPVDAQGRQEAAREHRKGLLRHATRQASAPGPRVV